MATRRVSFLLHQTFAKPRIALLCSTHNQHQFKSGYNALKYSSLHFSSQIPNSNKDDENAEEDEYEYEEYEDEYEYEYEDESDLDTPDDEDAEAAAEADEARHEMTETQSNVLAKQTTADTKNADDETEEYDHEEEEEEEDDDDEEYDEDEQEQEEEFMYGVDSDDEFTETLPYDVRDDPWWNEMLPATQQKFLFMQRHKNPEAWPNEIIPHAVKSSNYDYSTIKAIKRFPNLGKYAQRYTADADGRWQWDLNNVKLNTVEQLEKGVLYNQPSYKKIMPMIHKKECAAAMNPEVDYRVKAGDLIEVVMYTNLQKQKTQKITALCLMVKKKWHIAGSFMIRNVEKDGLTVIRQYPLHSPWVKSLKILKRHKVKRRKLYYMYNAPANVTDPVAYGESIGVRSRGEHFKWLKETEEGLKYARDYKLKRRMYFHGMRYRQNWARRLANLYNATAMTKNIKGPYKNAKREMKYRLRAKPHKIA